MRFLRQNTAVIVTVGPFYDKTDGVTIETGLTITNERITLTADTDAGSAPTNILDNVTGATSGTSNDLNYITGNDAGMMQLELAAADTNRVGRCLLSITDAANHVPVFHEFFILPQAIYDWLTGVIVPLPANVTTIAGAAVSTSTAQLGVNVVQAAGTAWASGAITAAVIATGAIDADAIADNAIDAGAIAADAITAAKIANGAIDAATFAAGAIDAAAIAAGAIDNATFAADVGSTAYATNIIALAADKAIVNAALGTAAELAKVPKSDSTVTWNATALASIQSETQDAITASALATAAALDAVDNFVDTEITALTNELAKVPKSDSNVSWNATALGAIQTEANDAIVANRLDELLNADSDIDGATPPTVGSVFHELLTKTAGSFTYDQTTDSLEAVRDNMGTAQTGDSFARLGAPAGASVSADIAAIEAQTDDIGIAGVGLTAVPWNAAWDAEVQSEVFDALDAAFTDATGLTANGLLDRIRTLGWIQRNKITVTDANGNTVIYKDDSVTAGFTVNAALTDDSTTTTRLRMA